jgi:acyl-coenzyme A thioesterase PaaI-like protein
LAKAHYPPTYAPIWLDVAPVGTQIFGESTPLHRGRTTMVWQTHIKNESGKLCAVVTQTQLVI